MGRQPSRWKGDPSLAVNPPAPDDTSGRQGRAIRQDTPPHYNMDNLGGSEKRNIRPSSGSRRGDPGRGDFGIQASWSRARDGGLRENLGNRTPGIGNPPPSSSLTRGPDDVRAYLGLSASHSKTLDPPTMQSRYLGRNLRRNAPLLVLIGGSIVSAGTIRRRILASVTLMKAFSCAFAGVFRGPSTHAVAVDGPMSLRSSGNRR